MDALDGVLAFVELGDRDDLLWHLASAGDLEGLRVAARLVEEWPRHAERRARAFALALQGRRDAALDELNRGWDGAWPPFYAHATDAAQIHVLCDDPEGALATLAHGLRAAPRLPAGARAVLARCVRARRSYWPRAVRIAVSGGRRRQQARALVAVAVAVLSRPPR